MNLNFDAFTYITGVASLLGLFLQLKDSFPAHREARKTIVLLVVGVFVGSVVASLRGIRVEFGASLKLADVVAGIFVSVLAIVAIAATFTKDSKHRSELLTFAGYGFVSMFFLLLLLQVGASDRERRQQQVNLDELLVLSDFAVSRSNFERALALLEEAKKRLHPEDRRMKLLEQREADLKAKQVIGK
jgi:hypothetical protein